VTIAHVDFREFKFENPVLQNLVPGTGIEPVRSFRSDEFIVSPVCCQEVIENFRTTEVGEPTALDWLR
jgi:hypothetical protein